MTHYIPAFTKTDGARQEAVCHRYVDPMQHSSEPICPDCRRWLGVEPELTHNMVPDRGIDWDWHRLAIGPCATPYCVGLTEAPEVFCLSCRYKAAQPVKES